MMEKNFLLVDDYELTRWLIEQVVYSLPVPVKLLSATNGVEALKTFEKNHIDFLITDYNMPQMDGLELVLNLRQQTQYQYLPIIMLTANKEHFSSLKKNQQARIDAVLQKPYKLDILKQEITRLMGV